MSSPYSYHPLDGDAHDIRLVELLPGRNNEPLKIRLIHVPLDVPEPKAVTRLTLRELKQTLPEDWEADETIEGRYIFWNQSHGSSTYLHPGNLEAEQYITTAIDDPYPGYFPTYEALSYVWGAPNPTEHVLVTATLLQRKHQETRDIGKIGLLKIQPNLHQALIHLREKTLPQLFWADAISINQADAAERNFQVKRMGDIYKLARRVRVWLGTASSDGSSRNALEILSDLGNRLEHLTNRFIWNPSVQEQEKHDVWDPLPYTADDFRNIKSLLERSWFDRLWIWQEIHLSAHRAIVQCGQDCIPWNTLRTSLGRVHGETLEDESLSQLSQLMVVRFRLFAPCIKYTNARASMFGLLRRTQGAQFSISHDRIFGLLGLATTVINEYVQADYALPIGRVFLDACLGIMAETGTLNFLESCDVSHDELEGKPSWVPNWLSHAAYSSEEAFAAGNSSAEEAHLIDDVMLKTYGVESGIIKHVDTPAPLEGALHHTVQVWAKNLESHIHPAEDAIINALSAITYRLLDQTTSMEAHRVECRRYLRGDYEQEVVERTGTAECISRVVRGRSLCLIDDQIGWCLKSTRIGDVVAVLLGTCYPMVLRPCMNQAYVVIGRCQAPQLLDTKALLGSLPDEWHVSVTWRYGDGIQKQIFGNSKTGELSFQDPRLGPLPQGWRFKDGFSPREPDNRVYESEATGEITKFDPRLSIQALISRGIPIRSFYLA